MGDAYAASAIGLRIEIKNDAGDDACQNLIERKDMEAQNVIRTLFEFTQQGYNEIQQDLKELIASEGKLTAEIKQQKAECKDLTHELSKLIKLRLEYEKSLNSSTSKSEREDYVDLKKKIVEVQAELSKLTTQRAVAAKSQEVESKKLKEAADMTAVYKKVLDELSKGLDNAEVSTEALAKAKKYLNSEMAKTNVGSEEYIKLSKAQAQVTKASNDITAAQRQQVKEMGIAENSIEGLRQKVAALNKQWREMDRTDPGFQAKKEELKQFTDELTKAEEEVGIFSRSVGNYARAGEAIAPVLQKINSQFPVLGKQLKGITGLMEISVGLMKAQASQAGLLAKAKTALGTANQWLAKTLHISDAAAKKLMATLTFGLSAAITIIIALWDQFSKEARAAAGAVGEVRKAMDFDSLGQDLANFERLVQAYRDLGDSAESKKKFLKDYREELDNTGIAVNDVATADKVFIDQTDEYISAMTRRAMSTAAMGLASKEFAKAVKAEADAEREWAKYSELREISVEDLKSGNFKGGSIMASEVMQLQRGSAQADEFMKKGQNFIKVANDMAASVAGIFKDGTSGGSSGSGGSNDPAKAYIDALGKMQKAAEDLRTAQVAGDKEAEVIYEKILADRTTKAQEALAEVKTMTQSQYDEIELATYIHHKNLVKIQEDADKKKAAEAAQKQKTITDGYLKASTDYRTAQASLLEAQKRGNADEIALFQRNLELKKTALGKYNDGKEQLDEEQRLAEEMAQFEFQQKIIGDYIALQQQLADLQSQHAAAQTQAEREAIQKQIDLVNAKVAAQVQAMQSLGVAAADIQTDAVKSIDKTQQYLTDQLAQSLKTIEQFAGKNKNSFFKLSTSISALVGKAFDIKKIREKYGDDAEGIKQANKEIAQSMTELGAAVLMNGLNAATELINEDLEQQKNAIDEMYEYQEQRAQESYDRQSRALKASLEDREISEAKYKLEQMKLDDKKAQEDKQREKDKANALYDIELKQFRVNQAKDAVMAGIATALAVTQSLPNFVMAAIVGALGLVQVGLILGAKPPQKPKFEKGGGIRFESIDGPSHDKGGVPIRFGNKVVAEAEGDEGALIISKKAMKDPYMRRLLSFVETVGSDISGKQSDPEMFEEGGYLSYDHFFEEARKGLRITDVRKRSIRINGKKVKLKPYNFKKDAAIDDYAGDIATNNWNDYYDQENAKLTAQQEALDASMDEKIANSAYFQSQGIGTLAKYNQRLAEREKDLKYTENAIKAYEDAADTRIEALKTELQYEEKLADFEKQRTEAAADLAKTTEEFNNRVLKELLDAGQITEDEYLSMLDQVKYGYGIKTSDIIALKKKEVEAIKALINEERNAELAAAQEVAKYREEALAQLRSEWEENYNAITQQIIDGTLDAAEAISVLTGTDLERFNQILHIQQEIQRMEEDYQKNETLLSDGIITSREERAALVAEQKRIKEELARKEQEAEEAKAAFEAEREKNMAAAQKAYETDNFEALLAQIKELGAELQTEGSKWTLDKQLAAELDAELQAINATYDEQIAKQDAIIDGLNAEIETAQLLHDQKIAHIKAEEDALKATFEEQKAAIEAWLANATAGMRTEAAELSQFISALKVAGLEAGLTEYQKAMEELNKSIDGLEATGGKKYATGGAIELGSGLFQVAGPSHSQGGVPISVGNTKIAEVEGIEKMFAVNKMAAHDPEMIAALARASDVNARYTGVPLMPEEHSSQLEIDYKLLAAEIGAQINSRPIHTFLTHRDIRSAVDITALHKQSAFMK